MLVIEVLPKDEMDETMVLLPCAGIDENGNTFTGFTSVAFLEFKFELAEKEAPLTGEEFTHILSICDSIGQYGEPWKRTWNIWRENGII